MPNKAAPHPAFRKTFAPLMMSLRQFADLHGISYELATQCANGQPGNYPPLKVRRVGNPGSKRTRIYVTAEAAAEWRANLGYEA